MNLALLLIRVVVGGTLAAHGSQKLFGWFGGGGLAGTGKMFESMGFRRVHALMAGVTEFSGGLALAVGFLTPLAAAAVLGVMFVAIAATSWKKGFFNMNGGYEFPLMLGLVGYSLSFSGAGRWSLDYAFGWNLGNTEWGIAAFVLAIATAFVVVSTRGWALSPRGSSPSAAR